ncbi:ABC transporter ATP-binding protein [Blastochloris viridis]|uniref:ABC transporter n=1 Tax=Blastochloris viridis TaxID=1079 RepID=A0A0H5BQ83_BLAVI|nr:ABC transporter ATP-binding protein [Blastochloris viridis]ALK09611.1 Iron import ATP-binding/permease protein IrtB [Blastochloris viridis]BAS00499.1 ABC transporter [Blastochloris viridis]CUU42274.1 Iron import ATP-binding/permease protein IrtB [Blastochloris viridis]
MKLFLFIWAHLGAARGQFVFSLFATLLEGVAAAVPAAAVGLGLVRLAQGNATPLDLAPYAAAVVAAFGVRVLALRVAWGAGFRAGNTATETVRRRLVQHMRAIPLGALTRWTPARLATLVGEDGRWINECSTFTLHRIIAGSATGLVLFALAALFSPLVAAVVIGTLLAALAVHQPIARILARVLATRSRFIADLNHRIGEYGEGIAVFRMFLRKGEALAQFQEVVEGAFQLMRRNTPRLVAMQEANSLLLSLGVPLALVAAAASGAMASAPETMVALFLAIAAQTAWTSAVIKQSLIYRLGEQARCGMVAFFAEPVLTGSRSDFNAALDVAADKVSFAYGKDGRAAVEDVSFTAERGTITAIVGPSGAGKSTVLALLARFYDSASGTIRIGGVDIAEADPARLQALISVVDQNVHLFRDTLRANILLGDPSANAARLKAVVSAARLDELVAALPHGLNTRLGDGGRTLSGGERQRVAVARALLKNAPIVVLDEATSAMDPLSEKAIQDAVAALESGRTVIVVAHRLHTIAKADQILVMDRGRIIERGHHDGLAAQGGVYAGLWAAQQRASGWRLR